MSPRRALRWRALVVATALLVAMPAVASAAATEARWSDREHAATTVTTATVPTVAITGCTAQPGNVARFSLQRGTGTLVPTLYRYEVLSQARVVVDSGTLSASQGSFDLAIGGLALLQRYTVEVRAQVAVQGGTWVSATPGQGHVEILSGLLAWSCGAGP